MKSKLTKEFLKEQKKKLLEEKKKIEKHLSSFSIKSKDAKGGWIAKYPQFGGGEISEEADEVEEFATRISTGHSMKGNLKKIKRALEKIKEGSYGICDKCKKSIPKGRLKIYPQAIYCLKCK